MPDPFARILVGYVATEQGADARALGVDLAAACGADLMLVSVVPAVWMEHGSARTGPALVHSGARDRMASALEEASAELASGSGLGHVERRLEASFSAARGLHDTALSEDADVIVVGSSRHGTLGHVLFGSVGERLLSGAPCAVALAPRGHATREPRPIRVVAVGFDGSPEAQVALRTAHGLAARTGATVRVLMVIEPPAAIPGHFVPLPGVEPLVTIERGEALERQELAAYSALEDALKALGGHVTVDSQVLVGGDPASAILDSARPDVDLLVLGSRAYGPVRRALLGSVSNVVVRHASCPVLVTPRVPD